MQAKTSRTINSASINGLLTKPSYVWKRSRYVGNEVAAVAAIDKDTALEAIDLIKVEYQALPAVFNVDEAMRPGAPLIWDKERNVGFNVERVFGDPDKAFRECDYVCEDRYETNQVAHCCLEVYNCIAKWDLSNRLTIWVNTQAPHTQRQEMARLLGFRSGTFEL